MPAPQPKLDEVCDIEPAAVVQRLRMKRAAVWRELLLEGAFLLATVALIFAGRLPAIVYPIRLNPDEVQMGANALRVLRHGAGWGSLDGTTVGPLSSLVLVWPALFGKDV